MLGIGLLTLWFLLWGHGIKRQSIKDLPARAILSLTGYLRSAPDPWLEATVRVAFAEFDRELALILRDRPLPGPAAGRRKASPGLSARLAPGTSLRPPHAGCRSTWSNWSATHGA
jgi:hypothetical protein